MIRNYFTDLELPIDATQDDVKLAYRRLARRFHPDLNPDDPEAANTFRMIHEAFEFLSAPERLEKLKRQLGVEVSKIKKLKDGKLTHIGSEHSGFTNVSKVRHFRKRPENPLDLHLAVVVDKIIPGNTQTIHFQYSKPCPECRAKDLKTKDNLKACTSCDGLGFQYIHRGANRWKKTCEICVGRGYVVTHCKTCSGKATVFANQLVAFKIPKIVDPKAPICLRGLGHISFDGQKRGDVWLRLEQKK